MNKEHVISDELWDEAQVSFSLNHNWIAYNTISYFLDKRDIFFFKEKGEALEFSDNNISEYDSYRVIYARSLSEMVRQIPYGKSLNKQLANMDGNGLYNPDGNSFTDALIEHIEQQQILNNKKLSNMNDKNYDYLSNQLKYTGFGEELKEKLKEKMQKQEPQFVLTFQKDYGKDQTASTLHFKKSEDSDMYFFNRYTLMLKNDNHPDPIKQTFYVNPKDNNITLKEGYNLMSGRAVHKELSTKEGEKYNAWLQLDFKETDANGNFKMKHYHENYKYDLAATLNRYPIKELENETDAKRLSESLERGNRQSVNLTINGKDQKVFIEAVPQFKSLNIYEASGQRIRSNRLYESDSQEQSVKKESKQVVKQGSSDEAGDFDMAPKKSKRKRQNIA